jgi:large conductance mechanosensitive channel
MKGFRDFVLRGNLIELAIAFIIGAAFAALVKAFTEIIVELLAKAGGAPNFDEWQPWGMTTVGPFLTAVIAFLIMAFVVYFLIFKPYEAAKEKFGAEPEAAAVDPNTELLTQIRDELRARA